MPRADTPKNRAREAALTLRRPKLRYHVCTRTGHHGGLFHGDGVRRRQARFATAEEAEGYARAVPMLSDPFVCDERRWRRRHRGA